MAQWGETVYGDGEAVPLRSTRCAENLPNGLGQHPCKFEDGHADEHKCICGAKWVTENA